MCTKLNQIFSIIIIITVITLFVHYFDMDLYNIHFVLNQWTIKKLYKFTKNI